MPEILKHVQQLSDLVTCTGVCKTWNAACQIVQPLHISIGGEEKKLLRVSGLTGILQWLQKQQSLRNLQSLQGITLIFTEGFLSECFARSCLHIFSQSCLVVAGCVSLTSCEFTDREVQLDTLVSLLPLTMQSLKVRGICEVPDPICLSVFQRLRNLQTLDLNIKRCSVSSLANSCFLLTNRLASLQTLVLVPRLFIMGDYATVLLPNLQCISANLFVFQAEAVLAHPRLRHARLTLDSLAKPKARKQSNGDTVANCKVHNCVLCVGEDSNLESVSLSYDGADPTIAVQLNIKKPNIDFDCCGVVVRPGNTPAAGFLPVTVKSKRCC